MSGEVTHLTPTFSFQERAPVAGIVTGVINRKFDQARKKASRSGLMVSACVVHIPCGKPS